MIPYSLVIATYERPRDLSRALASVVAQTHAPVEVAVIDASPGDETAQAVQAFHGRLPLRYARAETRSAATQRNQGAREVATPLIAFMDDDVALTPGVFATLTGAFANAGTGGVAGRIVGQAHPVPRGLLRSYYRLQAGYDHPTYGGKLFGPAINCLPTYTEEGGDLIPAEWLNSTCVCYRTELFRREQFPAYAGYAFYEDVHLSARIARTHRLYFHRSAEFEHFDASSSYKRNPRAFIRTRFRNQRHVAREVLGLRGPRLAVKVLLHRLFVTACLLRARSPTWQEELIGTWT
jgi:GT2 family glycosyltransferase